MKRFILFFTCSVLAASAARALTSAEQLNAVKDIFNQEFQKIDTNKDGVISADEYMLYQFELLQKSFAAAGQKEQVEPRSVAPTESVSTAEEKEDLPTLTDTTATLQDMANYEINDTQEEKDENENFEDEEWYMKPEKLTKEDVMPEEIPEDPDEVIVPEIDLSISEEENLKNILAKLTEVEETEEVQEQKPEEKAKDQKQIKFMLDTIKKTLPKKVDNITTWTDIVYQDNGIDYIYQADVDMNKFSDKEKTGLKENIEKVACAQAYKEMCPTIKTMFIDKGTNMKIRYYDKENVEISFCEFNNETCK